MDLRRAGCRQGGMEYQFKRAFEPNEPLGGEFADRKIETNEMNEVEEQHGKEDNQ